MGEKSPIKSLRGGKGETKEKAAVKQMTAAFVNRRRRLRSAVYFFRSIIEIEAIGILQVELEVAGANELETAHKLAYRKAQDSRGEDVEPDDFEESYADIHAALGERGDGFKYAD